MYIVNLYKRNLKLVMTCLFFFILFAYRTKEKLIRLYIHVYFRFCKKYNSTMVICGAIQLIWGTLIISALLLKVTIISTYTLRTNFP